MTITNINSSPINNTSLVATSSNIPSHTSSASSSSSSSSVSVLTTSPLPPALSSIIMEYIIIDLKPFLVDYEKFRKRIAIPGVRPNASEIAADQFIIKTFISVNQIKMQDYYCNWNDWIETEMNYENIATMLDEARLCSKLFDIPLPISQINLIFNVIFTRESATETAGYTSLKEHRLITRCSNPLKFKIVTDNENDDVCTKLDNSRQKELNGKIHYQSYCLSLKELLNLSPIPALAIRYAFNPDDHIQQTIVYPPIVKDKTNN